MDKPDQKVLPVQNDEWKTLYTCLETEMDTLFDKAYEEINNKNKVLEILKGRPWRDLFRLQLSYQISDIHRLHQHNKLLQEFLKKHSQYTDEEKFYKDHPHLRVLVEVPKQPPQKLKWCITEDNKRGKLLIDALPNEVVGLQVGDLIDVTGVYGYYSLVVSKVKYDDWIRQVFTLGKDNNTPRDILRMGAGKYDVFFAQCLTPHFMRLSYYGAQVDIEF